MRRLHKILSGFRSTLKQLDQLCADNQSLFQVSSRRIESHHQAIDQERETQAQLHAESAEALVIADNLRKLLGESVAPATK